MSSTNSDSVYNDAILPAIYAYWGEETTILDTQIDLNEEHMDIELRIPPGTVVDEQAQDELLIAINGLLSIHVDMGDIVWVDYEHFEHIIGNVYQIRLKHVLKTQEWIDKQFDDLRQLKEMLGSDPLKGIKGLLSTNKQLKRSLAAIKQDIIDWEEQKRKEREDQN